MPSNIGLSGREMSKQTDSAQDDYAAFARVNALLLDAPAALRNVPLRIYVPSSPAPAGGPGAAGAAPLGAFKVVQSLVAPRTSSRE